jgi:hypothetical protein
MDLRFELLPPALDETRVAHLAQLANLIDGARPGEWEESLVEFNRKAGTSLEWLAFQGVYGGDGAEEFVKNILVQVAVKPIPDIKRDEYLEIISRLLRGEGAEHDKYFWLKLLEVNLGDSRISDLLYWPGEYFGDGNNARELSAEQILEVAQASKGNS